MPIYHYEPSGQKDGTVAITGHNRAKLHQLTAVPAELGQPIAEALNLAYSAGARELQRRFKDLLNVPL